MVGDHGSDGSDAECFDLRTMSGMRERVLRGKRPVRAMLGGGRFADMLLWRNKMASLSIFIWVTSIWILVEWGGFHLLPLICYSLSCASMMLTFWSEISFIYHKLCGYFKQTRDGCSGSQPPMSIEATLPDDLIMHIKRIAKYVVEESSMAFQCTSLERSVYNFFMVNCIFWIVSIVGSLFDFVTILYIVFLIVYTSLAIYETYEDDFDSAIVMILLHIHRHYLVLNSTLLRTIQRFYFARTKLR